MATSPVGTSPVFSVPPSQAPESCYPPPTIFTLAFAMPTTSDALRANESAKKKTFWTYVLEPRGRGNACPHCCLQYAHVGLCIAASPDSLGKRTALRVIANVTPTTKTTAKAAIATPLKKKRVSANLTSKENFKLCSEAEFEKLFTSRSADSEDLLNASNCMKSDNVFTAATQLMELHMLWN